MWQSAGRLQAELPFYSHARHHSFESHIACALKQRVANPCSSSAATPAAGRSCVCHLICCFGIHHTRPPTCSVLWQVAPRLQDSLPGTTQAVSQRP